MRERWGMMQTFIISKCGASSLLEKCRCPSSFFGNYDLLDPRLILDVGDFQELRGRVLCVAGTENHWPRTTQPSVPGLGKGFQWAWVKASLKDQWVLNVHKVLVPSPHLDSDSSWEGCRGPGLTHRPRAACTCGSQFGELQVPHLSARENKYTSFLDG